MSSRIDAGHPIAGGLGFLALRYWQMPVGQGRFMAANSFYEHLGLAGGFLLVALTDLTSRD
jgi:uncharacterized membrane protein YphA (DoxX/SURF4 family)